MDIEKEINGLLDENNKVGERNAIIQIGLMVVFIISLVILTFSMTTNAQIDLFVIFIMISTIVSAIAFIFACGLDKTTEEEKMLQYARYLNEYWIKDNMIDQQFCRYIAPDDQEVFDSSTAFLYENFGIEPIRYKRGLQL